MPQPSRNAVRLLIFALTTLQTEALAHGPFTNLPDESIKVKMEECGCHYKSEQHLLNSFSVNPIREQFDISIGKQHAAGEPFYQASTAFQPRTKQHTCTNPIEQSGERLSPI